VLVSAIGEIRNADGYFTQGNDCILRGPAPSDNALRLGGNRGLPEGVIDGHRKRLRLCGDNHAKADGGGKIERAEGHTSPFAWRWLSIQKVMLIVMYKIMCGAIRL